MKSIFARINVHEFYEFLKISQKLNLEGSQEALLLLLNFASAILARNF